MVLRMACPTKRHGSDNWYFRRQIPADVRAILEKRSRSDPPTGIAPTSAYPSSQRLPRKGPLPNWMTIWATWRQPPESRTSDYRSQTSLKRPSPPWLTSPREDQAKCHKGQPQRKGFMHYLFEPAARRRPTQFPARPVPEASEWRSTQSSCPPRREIRPCFFQRRRPDRRRGDPVSFLEPSTDAFDRPFDSLTLVSG
jgi:hypothetical protein